MSRISVSKLVSKLKLIGKELLARESGNPDDRTALFVSWVTSDGMFCPAALDAWELVSAQPKLQPAVAPKAVVLEATGRFNPEYLAALRA
ncbi:hypothetical protein [Burkholderia ambifaria]|uniref:hypothetical protein n=1 Tax=Burkholderia ambifaria TaxID=152480 RepID=UPI000F7FF9CE|nr:hypothetical protein [Burkholderia ambifaria]